MSEPVVKFFKDEHSYIKKDRVCYSANKVKDYFKPKFDGKYWGKYKALELCIPNFLEIKGAKFTKYPYTMKPPESWLDELIESIPDEWYEESRAKISGQWVGASDKGSMFHDEREQEAYTNGYRINPWDKKEHKVTIYKKEYDNESVVRDLSVLEDGCYPELLVWHDVGQHITITGQIDDPYIETIKGKRYADINDYKCWQKFRKSKSSEKYRAPFDHLDTSKLTNTAVQVSIYMYILEQWGYESRNLGCTRYKDYSVDSGKLYDLPYYKEEVEKMITLFVEDHDLITN